MSHKHGLKYCKVNKKSDTFSTHTKGRMAQCYTKCHHETITKLSSGFEPNIIQNYGQTWTNMFTATLVCLRNRKANVCKHTREQPSLKIRGCFPLQQCNIIKLNWAMWHMEYFIVRMTWILLFFFPLLNIFVIGEG